VAVRDPRGFCFLSLNGVPPQRVKSPVGVWPDGVLRNFRKIIDTVGETVDLPTVAFRHGASADSASLAGDQAVAASAAIAILRLFCGPRRRHSRPLSTVLRLPVSRLAFSVAVPQEERRQDSRVCRMGGGFRTDR
jgi:hypothetical protein